jgi:hypothetical protein
MKQKSEAQGSTSVNKVVKISFLSMLLFSDQDKTGKRDKDLYSPQIIGLCPS